jgi:DNA-binding HxlR family transcriptional regulator
MDFPAPARIISNDAEIARWQNRSLRLPGRGVSENDQRQIQVADHLGLKRWSAALRRNQNRPIGASGSSEIAPRVLSRELKALTGGGLIDRKDFGVVPPKVEYRLTRKGKSFVPVVAAIRNWGMRHLAEAGASEMPDGMAAAE